MSIDKNTARAQLYRASLALNNVSVTLIEKGQYAEALDFLRTAVNQMLSVVYGHEVARPIDGMAADNKYKIQKAYKHLATCQQEEQQQQQQQPHRQEKRENLIETVFFEDTLSAFSCADAESNNPLSRTVGHLRPTKIEPADVNSLTEVDACLHMVLLLNNFGLSTYLLSTIRGNTQIDGKLLENAHSIFSLATTSISELIAYHHSSQIEQVRLMSVALLITGNLSEIHTHTGRITGSREFFEFVDMHRKIREAMGQLYMTEWLSDMAGVCASPAA